MKYIIVPNIVCENKNLNSTEKLVMGMICSLNYKGNDCFASNEYLAKRINVSKRTITSSLAKLKKEGLIKIEYINHTRKLYIIETGWKNTSIGVEENC